VIYNSPLFGNRVFWPRLSARDFDMPSKMCQPDFASSSFTCSSPYHRCLCFPFSFCRVLFHLLLLSFLFQFSILLSFASPLYIHLAWRYRLRSLALCFLRALLDSVFWATWRIFASSISEHRRRLVLFLGPTLLCAG
jgi:hypothetical protein